MKDTSSSLPDILAPGRIVAAAMVEFREHGVEAARMEDIAARAGLSKQLIYYYYGNKGRLYEHAIQEHCRRSHQPLLDHGFDALPPLAAIEAYVGMFLEHAEEGQRLLDARHMERSGVSAKVFREICGLGQRLLAILERIVRRGQDDGCIVARVDPLHLFIQIVLLSSGLNAYSLLLSDYSGHDLTSARASADWRAHVIGSILAIVEMRAG